MKSPTRRFRPGFTLIELIVVISIIALLVALLLPSLAKTKSKSQGVVCSTRVRGLTIALATYLADWGDCMPTNGVIMPKKGLPIAYDPAQTPGCDLKFSASEAKFNDQWRLEFGAIWPYMGGPPLPVGTTFANVSANPLPLTNPNVAKAYICPADMPILNRTYAGSAGDTHPTQPLWMDVSSGVPRVQQGVGSPGFWSYSVNSVLNPLGRFRDRWYTGGLPWSDPLRMFNVKSPHDFITFIEEDNNSLFNDEVFDSPAFNGGDMLTGRHNGQGNVGFGDGHVELFNQVLFNEVPSGVTGQNVDYTVALSSEITHKFFPDRGAFANP